MNMRIVLKKREDFLKFQVAMLCIWLTVFAVASADGAEKKYPDRAIEVIINMEAGGGADSLFRITAKHLSKELGVPIIVVNKGGGGGISGVLDAMAAKPDGYTLMKESQSSSSFHMGRKDLAFDPLNRTFICDIAISPYALFSDSKMPWKTLSDVAAFIKKEPEKFIWGGLGGPSGTTFSQLQFFDAIGADLKKMKMVTYKGSGPILIAAAGGHVMFGSAAASAVPPFHQGGKVKVLAVTGDKSVKNLPGVPSAKDAGYKLTLDMWSGLSGPPNLPAEVVSTIDRAVRNIIQYPEFIADLEKVCSVPSYRDAATVRKLVIEEGKFAVKMREIMSW
jgi:tripartite-type tricarboxylate transporter receptor subunit TctC